MHQNKKILALIPARGGSKGIPGKNIKPLSGKPLIEWTIDAAKKSKYIDRLILSSDDEEIIKVAKRAGCEIPFIRPKELAQDQSSSMDVILHALDAIEEEYDYLLLLQPTSPFRQTKDIDHIIEACLNNNHKIMVSVSKSEQHPFLMYRIEDTILQPILENSQNLRRQDMPSVYELNGALYLANVQYLKQAKSFGGPDVHAFIMEGHQIDIDDPIDWVIAETLIAKGLI